MQNHPPKDQVLPEKPKLIESNEDFSLPPKCYYFMLGGFVVVVVVAIAVAIGSLVGSCH